MRRGEATKQRITRTALELFVEKGVKETTIRDIAEAAGVAEGTLYRHYESKEALAESLFAEHYEAMAAALENICTDAPSFRDALERMIGYFCRAFDEDWILFSYLLLSQHRHLRERGDERPSPYNVLKRAIAEAAQTGKLSRAIRTLPPRWSWDSYYNRRSPRFMAVFVKTWRIVRPQKTFAIEISRVASSPATRLRTHA